jgi:hypothetical protein
MNGKWLLPIILFLLIGNAKAQLRMKGTIFSNGPVQIALSIETYHETHFMYLEELDEVQRNGEEVFRSNYDLPWLIVKDYNHTIKVTDGTVEKIIFVQGDVPDNIIPKQTYQIDIDLTDDSNADMLLVVFWSLPDDSYIALPYAELETIKAKCMDPFFWELDGLSFHIGN